MSSGWQGNNNKTSKFPKKNLEFPGTKWRSSATARTDSVSIRKKIKNNNKSFPKAKRILGNGQSLQKCKKRERAKTKKHCEKNSLPVHLHLLAH